MHRFSLPPADLLAYQEGFCAMDLVNISYTLQQGCTNPGLQVARETNGGTKYFCVLLMEIVSCHLSGAQNFEVAPRFLEHLSNFPNYSVIAHQLNVLYKYLQMLPTFASVTSRLLLKEPLCDRPRSFLVDLQRIETPVTTGSGIHIMQMMDLRMSTRKRRDQISQEVL